MRHGRGGPGRPLGFTLIELLVVVAVIALLVGLVLPALGAAKRAGKAAVCLSNQRQIGVALMMYAEANRDRVPREGVIGVANDPRGTQVAWPVALRPYLEDVRVTDGPLTGRLAWTGEVGDKMAGAVQYRCPARAKDRHPVHFVDNGFAFSGPGVVDARRKDSSLLARIWNPAGTMYLTDFADDPGEVLFAQWNAQGTTDMSLAQFYDIWEAAQIDPRSGELRLGYARHDGGANALFLDGHARPAPRGETTGLAWWDDRDYRR